MNGYIKIHRKILDNPIVCKDGDHFAIWCYLLLNATHKELDVLFKGERLTLKEGQLLTGRKSISQKLKISESKVQRVLNRFESEQQIEQQTSSQNRLITITKWHEYQESEQQIEQQLNNERTTTEQRVNTNKNDKNVINIINNKKENIKRKKFEKPTLEEVSQYCKERKNNINPSSFINYYESNGWMVGKNPMKDWKACVRSWETKNYNKQSNNKLNVKLPEWFGKEIKMEEDKDAEEFERRVIEYHQQHKKS